MRGAHGKITGQLDKVESSDAALADGSSKLGDQQQTHSEKKSTSQRPRGVRVPRHEVAELTKKVQGDYCEDQKEDTVPVPKRFNLA